MTPSQESHTEFNSLMTAGVLYNNSGEHEEALKRRFEAYKLAEPSSMAAGHAARDIAHSFMRLADDGEVFSVPNSEEIVPQNQTLAMAYAEHAVRVHGTTAREQRGDPLVLREYRASAGLLGTLCLQQAIDSERNGTYNIEAIYQASTYLGEAVRPPEDQYTVNFSGRHAVQAALYHPRHGVRRELHQARKLARHSEASDMPHHNPTLTPKERRAARHKAGLRVLAATAINAISPMPILDRTPNQGPRRKLALWLARKVI